MAEFDQDDFDGNADGNVDEFPRIEADADGLEPNEFGPSRTTMDLRPGTTDQEVRGSNPFGRAKFCYEATSPSGSAVDRRSVETAARSQDQNGPRMARMAHDCLMVAGL